MKSIIYSHFDPDLYRYKRIVEYSPQRRTFLNDCNDNLAVDLKYHQFFLRVHAVDNRVYYNDLMFTETEVPFEHCKYMNLLSYNDNLCSSTVCMGVEFSKSRIINKATIELDCQKYCDYCISHFFNSEYEYNGDDELERRSITKKEFIKLYINKWPVFGVLQ